MNFTNKKFIDESVNLDNNTFMGCEFIRCVLIYDASGVTSFVDCVFDAPKYALRGAAQRTIQFLTALYGAGDRATVEATFDNIRRGAMPKLPKPDARN